MEKERDAFLIRMRSVKEQRSKLAVEVEAKVRGSNEFDAFLTMLSLCKLYLYLTIDDDYVHAIVSY
jgi:hypothetical protein